MSNHDELIRAGFVELRTVCPGIVCDMRYSTEHNLTGEVLYDSDGCYLRRPVAEALQKVQSSLESAGLGLKVWDAYRPVSVQNKLVTFVADTDYTPNVSNHSKGIALDVTLVDISTGQELEMPTKHDDLSTAAHENAIVKNPQVLKNREMLKSTMHKMGFTVYPYEWWHFDYLEMVDSEPLDIRI